MKPNARHAREFAGFSRHRCQLIRGARQSIPFLSQVPDGKPNDVSPRDAPNISDANSDPGGLKRQDIALDQLRGGLDALDNQAPPGASGGPANKDGVDYGGGRSADMNRCTHFRRTWQRRRASKPGIKYCNCYGVISLQAIMMKSEGQRRPWLQGLSHLLENG